jgi:hypothetical protein
MIRRQICATSDVSVPAVLIGDEIQPPMLRIPKGIGDVNPPNTRCMKSRIELNFHER